MNNLFFLLQQLGMSQTLLSLLDSELTDRIVYFSELALKSACVYIFFHSKIIW